MRAIVSALCRGLEPNLVGLTRGSEGRARSSRGTQIGLFFELPRDIPERGRGLGLVAELMNGVEVRPEYAGTTSCFSKRSSGGVATRELAEPL